MNSVTIAAGSLAIAFFLLAIHPFVTYPLSLVVIRALRGVRPIQKDPEKRPQSFSIVFCAYNEEDVLEHKLNNLSDIVAAYPDQDVEVLAYNDCSADRTGEILASRPDLLRAFQGSERAGKSTGMNTLIGAAKGEIVVLTDANVQLDRGVLAAFADVFSDPEIGVGCGNLIYTNENTTTAKVGTSYWKFEEWLKTLETETGSTMGADGSLFAIRRDLFRTVPADIIDDFFTSISILCDGHRSVRVDEAIAYERSVEESSQEYRRKVRIACRAFNCYRLLRPRLKKMTLLNRYKYASHKLIRWLVAVWFTAAAVLAVIAVGTGAGWMWGGIAAAIIGVGWMLGRLSSAFPIPIFGKLYNVWTAFLATGHGVWCSLRGERFQTWVPAASVRKI